MTGRDVAPLAAALGWPSYGIARRWAECLLGHRDMFVADLDGAPVGSASVNESAEMPGLLHLFALDVVPPLQSRGIGTRLIAQVEEEAGRRGLAGVYLDVGVENPDARRLYERLGYEQQGEPFQSSWNRYGATGKVTQEVVEMVCRMVKRL